MSKKILGLIMISIMFISVLIPNEMKVEASSVQYKYVKVNSGSKLNVRSKPTTKAKIKFKLSNSTKIKVIQNANKWSKIDYKGKTGYVSSEFLSSKKSTKKSASTSKVNKIIKTAKAQIGKPYVYGASGPNSFDCSGFVYYVMKESGVKVTRNSSAGHWKTIDKVKSPKEGDVVFLENTYKPGPSHMGIYIGDGNYINAKSVGEGIKIDSLYSSYTQKHLLGFGRF